jgi:hypothetical protein
MGLGGLPHDGKIQREENSPQRSRSFTEKRSFDICSVFSVSSAVKYQLRQNRLGDETLSRIRVLVRRTHKERNQLRGGKG